MRLFINIICLILYLNITSSNCNIINCNDNYLAPSSFFLDKAVPPKDQYIDSLKQFFRRTPISRTEKQMSLIDHVYNFRPGDNVLVIGPYERAEDGFGAALRGANVYVVEPSSASLGRYKNRLKEFFDTYKDELSQAGISEETRRCLFPSSIPN